jgi:cytochrome oxidase assembly protein ShyY1
VISTGTLMLGKALLTAAALLGFGFWQLHQLRRLRRERSARDADAAAPARARAADPNDTTTQERDHAANRG